MNFCNSFKILFLPSLLKSGEFVNDILGGHIMSIMKHQSTETVKWLHTLSYTSVPASLCPLPRVVTFEARSFTLAVLSFSLCETLLPLTSLTFTLILESDNEFRLICLWHMGFWAALSMVHGLLSWLELLRLFLLFLRYTKNITIAAITHKSTINTGITTGTAVGELFDGMTSDWSAWWDIRGTRQIFVPFFLPLFSMNFTISSTELVSLFLLCRSTERFTWCKLPSLLEVVIWYITCRYHWFPDVTFK